MVMKFETIEEMNFFKLKTIQNGIRRAFVYSEASLWFYDYSKNTIFASIKDDTEFIEFKAQPFLDRFDNESIPIETDIEPLRFMTRAEFKELKKALPETIFKFMKFN